MPGSRYVDSDTVVAFLSCDWGKLFSVSYALESDHTNDREQTNWLQIVTLVKTISLFIYRSEM